MACSLIGRANRLPRQRRRRTPKIIAENSCKLISERLARELVMKDAAQATSNAGTIQHHGVLANAYKSILEGDRQPGRLKTRLITSFFIT